MDINDRNKGLAVLSGCAHSGIINTVNYAIEINWIHRVWAIMGRFQLARADDVEIQRTIDEIQVVEPKLIVTCYCTVFRAMCNFAEKMLDVFKEGVVGATYLF